MSHPITHSNLDMAVYFQGRTTSITCPYFVLDLPPRQLTDQKLHQHVEEGPKVVMTTHLLQTYVRFKLTFINIIGSLVRV